MVSLAGDPGLTQSHAVARAPSHSKEPLTFSRVTERPRTTVLDLGPVQPGSGQQTRATRIGVQMLNPWMAFSFQAVRLGWEAQNQALRLLGLAEGGTHGRKPKVSEKIDARSETPTSAASVSINGAQTAASPTIKPVRGRQVATKIMKVLKTPDRAKKRRLSK